MIGILKQPECCPCTKLFDKGLQQLQMCQLIAGSLYEEHRNLYMKEVFSAVIRWPARRMKRKSKEYQAANSGQRRFGLGLGSHSPAKGFPAGQ